MAPENKITLYGSNHEIIRLLHRVRLSPEVSTRDPIISPRAKALGLIMGSRVEVETPLSAGEL